MSGKCDTALVTGASSGFGEAICRRLVKDGYHVIGAARRIDRLEKLRTECGDRFHPLRLDVTSEAAIAKSIDKIPKEIGHVDILINNAGLALGLGPAHAAKWSDWKTMIDTNVVGLALMTRVFLPAMVSQGYGHIINLGSIAGAYPYPGGNVYGATKAFVAQFSLNLRADLSGTGVRVTNIEPGLCSGTEFSLVRFQGDQEKVKTLYDRVQAITPEDISETVSWIIAQPEHFNVNSIEIMPTCQSFSPLSITRMKE